jgi:membrane protein involved in colicin uptake
LKYSRETMNLAPPAPKVEPAKAEKARQEDRAAADMAQQSEAVRVTAAKLVDPALPVDDPMRYAPFIVANPKQLNPSALSAGVLRGENGSDFESYAAVFRGAPEKIFLKQCLPFFFDERDWQSAEICVGQRR